MCFFVAKMGRRTISSSKNNLLIGPSTHNLFFFCLVTPFNVVSCIKLFFSNSCKLGLMKMAVQGFHQKYLHILSVVSVLILKMLLLIDI